MINGRMSEAVNEVAALEDVETETFVHFIQWAYTGSYKVERNDNNNNNYYNSNKNNDVGANRNELREATTDEDELPGKVLGPSLKHISPRRSRHLRNSKWGFAEKDYFSRSPLENLKKAFCERDYPVIESPLLLVEPSSSSYNNNGNDNDNNRELRQDQQPDLFLPHAKMFVFAEKYDIQPLKMLAIHNLHHALSHYQLLPQHVSDITNSIQYSYENTHASDDLLRELLASYVELEMAVLIEAKPFEDLLEEGGDFVGDFLKRVKKRIS